MFTRQLRSLVNKRLVHSGRWDQGENPIWRTIRILSDDLKGLKNLKKYNEEIRMQFPRHCDVVIIGGGAMGSSIAYWLKEKSGKEGLDIVVIEKDPTVSIVDVIIMLCSNRLIWMTSA